MEKNILTSAAVFMICLIVMFPVYSSAAMADSGISLIRTYDKQHNVEGFMQTGGEFTVEAHVKIDGDDDINTTQVKIGSTDFAECGNPDPDWRFTCLYSFQTSGFLLNKPSQSYDIKLYNDLANIVDTKSASITFDDLAPVINSFDAPDIVGKGAFAMDYAARDPVSSESGCSGIGWIKIYLNDAAEPLITEIINTSLCSYSGEIEIQGESLVDGMNILKMKVFDRLGHESSVSSESVEVELSEISVTSTELIDDSGEVIEWFVPHPSEALLVVTFSGPSIKESTLKADLSEINPTLQSVSADRCVESDGITSCEWDSVMIDIPSAKTAHLTFEMEDYAGNQVVKTKNLPMPVDTQGPTAISLRSAFAGVMNYMSAEDNKFIAIINENAALDPLKINLYIGDIARGDENYYVKAESCELTGASQWQCNFTDIGLAVFPEGLSNIYILTDSKDKYGNYFTNNYSIDLIMDQTLPVLTDMNVRIISAEEEIVERDYVQVGDSLEVTIKIDEENELGDIYGDFSSIISGANHSVPSCNKEEDVWVCVWETHVIDKGYTDSHFSLHIEDMAGNAIPQDIVVPIEVFGVEIGESIEWSADIKFSSPSAIDRQIVTLYEPFMWVGLVLSSADSSVIPVEVSITECFNTEQIDKENKSAVDESAVDAAAFLSDIPEVYNYNTLNSPSASSYPLYIKFNLLRMAPEEGSLKITCSFNIKGIKDGRTVIYSPPVNASFNINYFNNNIGDIETNVQDEIDDVKDGWLVQAEWLGQLEKILSYGQMACSLVNTMAEVISIFTLIKDSFGEACATGFGSASCPLSKATGGLAETTKEATFGFYETVNPYCKMLNCQYSKDDEMNQKDDLHKSLGWITGSRGFVQRMENSGKDRNAWLGNLDPYVKNSLFLSILYICLPGVIYNLQKARAVDCIYINCLNQVENGMPIATCTSQRGYAYCKFVFGEIFNVIPFASAISNIAKNIQKALSHPAELIGFALRPICKYFCETPESFWCSACTVVDFMDLFADVACDLGLYGGEKCDPIWESFSNVGEDACSEALGDDGEEGEEE
ncbi:MAG: hypothetical protein U9R34_06535 [Nanoarchaeota archaeon]|nr:hypothetical protein [Nanoarchaeota archaeon]